MRVIIKKAGTEEYYTDTGGWTTKREQAKTFNNTVDAMMECSAKKLRSNIVLSFRDPRYDIKFPCK